MLVVVVRGLLLVGVLEMVGERGEFVLGGDGGVLLVGAEGGGVLVDLLLGVLIVGGFLQYIRDVLGELSDQLQDYVLHDVRESLPVLLLFPYNLLLLGLLTGLSHPALLTLLLHNHRLLSLIHSLSNL